MLKGGKVTWGNRTLEERRECGGVSSFQNWEAMSKETSSYESARTLGALSKISFSSLQVNFYFNILKIFKQIISLV